LNITLGELIEGMEDAVVQGDPATVVSQLEYDSRQIKPGSLFVAIRGYRRDGHDFLAEARANGAVAAVGERESGEPFDHYVRVPDSRKALADLSARFYGYPGKRIKACGVTGTNGKTTTCFLLKYILEARQKTTGLVTTQLYDTGKERFAAERTTPESLDVQRLLYLMKKNNCVNAVIEVSSHALILRRVDQINFRVAVYTNITRDHLDFHETMENYLEAKKLLLKKVEGPLSYVVINLDVPEFRSFYGEVVSSYITYSLSNREADVHCGEFELRPEGTAFQLVTPMGEKRVNLQLPGRFNLINAMAAAAGGLACGVDLDAVCLGLERAEPVPGRLNPVSVGQPFSVYVDYAHTPDALERLCEAVRELCTGRLLLLFGCGGDRDRGKRPMMGEVATRSADYVVVTSDNPRSEDPEKIIEDIQPGLTGSSYEIQVDRKDAISAVLRQARAGDAVLLAGKGAETYQDIKGTRHPFNDSDEAMAVLAELGYTQQKVNEER
jgi:UDP-N-acetylmuramoyl-L-alanyl-D-glutamate--2,6-diaminopimelate ligase